MLCHPGDRLYVALAELKGPAITPLRAQGKDDDLFQYKDMSGLAAWLRTLGMSTFSFMGVILAFSSPLFAPACASNGVPELYNSYASSYNILNGGKSAEALGINELRVKAGAVAMGDVLEVAVGTGLELDYLNLRGEGNTIKSVVGIDISTGMLSEAAKKVQAALNTPVVKVPTKLLQMDAGAMSFPDNKFDTVQSTFSFCVFEEPDKVMKEMMRVVKPGGQVVLLENSVSSSKALAAIQDLTEPFITPLSKNCRWNVNVPKIAEKAGLKKQSEEAILAGTIYYGVYTK